jgi:hypothetical protein
MDMENCVFADEGDVLDKIDYLFSRPEELARITDAGHALVHARHTAAQRDELLQWLRLYKQLSPDEKIVQRGPFTPLEVAPNRPDITNGYVLSGGVDRELLRRGELAKRAGNYEEARELYRRCLNFHAMMPEPMLGLAECALFLGRPEDAISLTKKSVSESLEIRRSFEPDPVEWAFYIRSLMCGGSPREAVRRARQFPSLQHEELARIRWAVCHVFRDASLDSGTPAAQSRYSLHSRPRQSPEAWLSDLCAMLDACGKEDMSKLLRARERELRILQQDLPRISSSDPAPQPTVYGPARISRPRERLETWLRSRTRPWRQRFFGPGDFGLRAQRWAKDEPAEHAFIIGSSARRGFVKAVLRGFMENPTGPKVQVLDSKDVLKSKIDLPHVDGSIVFILGEAVAGVDIGQVRNARLIVLDGISGHSSQQVHEQIARLDGLMLVACDFEDGDGYAVYRRAAIGVSR